MRHELTHGWTGYTYGKNKSQTVWLDETISMLMEVDVHGYNDTLLVLAPDYVEKYFVPLDTLFVMSNPVNRVITGEYGIAYMMAIYAQFLSVSDFFLERSLDPAIYRSLAEHFFERGGTMAEWLRATGPQYDLPTNVAELEREWRHWFAFHSPNPKVKWPNP
jgi:hypothetical protein